MTEPDLLLLSHTVGRDILEVVLIWSACACGVCLLLYQSLKHLGAFSIAGEPRRSLKSFTSVTLFLLFVPAAALVGGVGAAGNASVRVLKGSAEDARFSRSVGAILVVPLYWVHSKERDAHRVVPVDGDDLWDADLGFLSDTATQSRLIGQLSPEVIQGIASRLTQVEMLRERPIGRWVVGRAISFTQAALRGTPQTVQRLLRPFPSKRPLTLAALSRVVGERLIARVIGDAARRSFRRVQWTLALGASGIVTLLLVLANWGIRRRQRALGTAP